jgi:RNA polymerase sigma-54 factor
MRFDTSQHMRLGQQMKLAPRMIQSMEILQMPLAELEERLEQELASNPTLEQIEPGDDGELATRERSDDHAESASNAEDFERLEDFEAANPDYVDNAYDGPARDADRFDREHEPSYSASRLDGERDAKADAFLQTPARDASLHDQLLAQWGVVDVQDRLRPLGAQIIQFLDDDGYLRTPLEEVADRAPGDVRDSNPTEADWELALRAVQLLLEPAGVAARDAAECLLLQIDAAADAGETDRLGAPDAVLAARTLIEDHLEDLMKNRLPRIAGKSGLSLEEINAGIEVMRRLSLAPARRLVTETAAAITPDAIVEYDEDADRYIAYLNDRRTMQVRINREYALLAKDRSLEKKDRDFLKTNLSNAQWLLDAIGQRRQTLLRVVNAVLDEQRDFFDYGPEAIKPLPMKTVADRLGIHVATVSRAVSDKHLLTPRGIVPLRSLFTQGLSTESGEDVAAAAVKAALREIIEAEDKASPLSDDALVTALKDRGYDIARRTVAKYRGQLDIPTARMRKQFA